MLNKFNLKILLILHMMLLQSSGASFSFFHSRSLNFQIQESGAANFSVQSFCIKRN